MEVNTEIVVASIAAVAGLASTALSLWQRKPIREMHAEVKNTHETNLRDDMDHVVELVERVIDGQARHDKEIAGIRDELRDERQERMALAARIDYQGRHR